MRHIIKLRRLHRKANAILEMIEKITSRIEKSEDRIERYKIANWNEPIRLVHTQDSLEEKLEMNKAILHRLIQWYNGTISQIGFYASQSKETV